MSHEVMHTEPLFFNLYTLPLFANSVFLGLLAYHVWIRKHHTGAGYLVMTLLFSLIYSFFYGLEISSTSLPTALFFIRLEYLGIAFISPFFLLFALSYTENVKMLSPVAIAAILLIPAITAVLGLSLGHHTLIHENIRLVKGELFPVVAFRPGVWYRVSVAYNNFCIFFSNLLFIRLWSRSLPVYRRQVVIIVTGSVVPWISDLSYHAGLSPWGIDPAPFALSFSAILIYIGLFYYKFFDLAPVVREIVYENIPDAVFVIDRKNRITDCNKSARLLLDIDIDAMGKPADTILKEWPELRKLIDRKEPGIQTDLNMHTGAGESWFDLGMLDLPDKTGAVTGRIVVLHDITSHKQIEADLIATREKAEAASLAKSSFLANMSHEIRTPLNGLVGFSSLMMQTRLDEIQRTYINMVNNSGKQLLGLINDILDLSKIEAGKQELSEETVSLEELAEQVVDMIVYAAHSKEIEVLLDIPANLPGEVRTDPACLKQILINLLGNAVKFTSGGEIEFRIETGIPDTSPGHMNFVFSVRDTGIGISPGNVKEIFEAFSQEDMSTTRKYGGTGLGLTISNKLLLMMGSSLQLESTPGIGSRFFFTLCLPVNVPGKNRAPKDPACMKKVLIVDSNESNRRKLSNILEALGIGFETASDAVAAIEKAASCQAGIVDYHLSGMNGIDLAERLFRKQTGMSIILMFHATDDPSLFRKARETGICASMLKPVKRNQILEFLSSRKTLRKTPEINGKIPETVLKPVECTILIAEDNKTNMLLARTVLLKILPEATILEAVNGKEALSLFSEHQPDLVFMDIHMPEMNGFEASAAIRRFEKTGHCPIIAMTADSLKEVTERYREFGIDDCIIKPYTQEALLRVTGKWLKKGFTEATQ